MRVFVGIKVSEELEQKILKWQNLYREKLDVRWMSRKNLHVTLVPPWDEKNINEVKEKLHQVRSEPFEILFEKIDFGPSEEPRLIWLEGTVPQELMHLQKDVLNDLNKTSQNRPFKLHVTLARFRPEKMRDFPIRNLNESINWKMKADSFVLFQSILSSKGAEYEILEVLKL